MTLRYIKMPVDTKLKTYLKDAELNVNVLTDEELAQAEAQLEARISLLAFPPQSIVSRGKNRILWQKCGLAGFLLAAVALILIRNQPFDHESQWQTKGLSDSTVCDAFVVQNGEDIVLDADVSYPVNLASAIYVKADCLESVVIERFNEGQWEPVMNAELIDNVLSVEGQAYDFRALIGDRLRLKADNGVSHEFALGLIP